MKTNLSSQITLNRVSPRYYRPENAFERSVLTRLEKIPTDIYESAEEGANHVAYEIAQLIRDKQKAGHSSIFGIVEIVNSIRYLSVTLIDEIPFLSP